MLVRGSLMLCLAIAGCQAAPAHETEHAKSPPPSISQKPPPETVSSPCTNRWWHVVDASTERSVIGSGVLLRDGELVFVSSKGEINRKPAHLERTTASGCEWLLSGATIRVKFERETNGGNAHLSFASDEGGPGLELGLQAEEQARAIELDRLEASNRPSPDACARAEACCKAAEMRAEWSCDPDDMLGVPRDPHTCLRFLQATREVFTARSIEVPRECR